MSYGRKPRPKPPAPSPLSLDAIKPSAAADEDEPYRRKPRAQDFVAALIAVAIVVAILGSAIIPFFMY